MSRYIRALRAPTADDKLSPQARTCVDVMFQEFGDKKIERKDAVAAIAKSGKLTTRQDPARVLGFYQPRLVEAGLVELETVNVVRDPDGKKPSNVKNSETAAAKDAKPATAPKVPQGATTKAS